MASPAEKWAASSEAIAEASEQSNINIEAVPLGGEGNDVKVDFEAERRAREELKARKEKDRQLTKNDLKVIRGKVAVDIAAMQTDLPPKHREQPFENYPTSPVKEPAGRSREWLDNHDSFIAKFIRKFTKN